MKEKFEPTLNDNLVTPTRDENPMQERHCKPLTVASETSIEAIFTARRSEFREEAAGDTALLFVP